MALVRKAPVGSPAATLPSLDSADPMERREAIRRMPNAPDANAALARRLDIEPLASVRDLILTTLVERRSEQTVQLLVHFLASEDPSLRNAVAGVLALMPELMAGQVPALLVADDHDLRIMTIMVLGKLRHPEVPDWLVGVADADPHPNVVGCALNELLQLAGLVDRGVFSRAAARFPGDPFIGFLATLPEAQPS